MDNLKYYNDSLAYDFNMFMPREKREDNIVKLPKPERKAKAASKQVSVTFSAVMISALLLGILCGNIFLRLKTNEVNSKINETKVQIEELKNEKTALEVELDGNRYLLRDIPGVNHRAALLLRRVMRHAQPRLVALFQLEFVAHPPFPFFRPQETRSLTTPIL